MTRFVVPLRGLGRQDVLTAGGKGANLGELVRAGFPVPEGFVVTTAAYEAVAAAAGLEGSGGELEQRFGTVSVPVALRDEVLGAWSALGSPPVAVRSSATAEDLATAAFAGQQETFLNVIEPEALIDAIRRCWGSLWNPRAIEYRARQQLDGPVRMAVVVQRMVEAKAAGVMFTANPVTGARDELVIEASAGLGESVVSGEVTPDHFTLRKRLLGWRVLESRRGRGELVVRSDPAGGLVRSQGEGGAVVLTRAQLARLGRLGQAIARHFGSPQDIEWVLAPQGVAIVQARPITALPTPAPRLPRLASAMIGEMISERPYPIDLATWFPAVFGAVAPLFELLGFSPQHHRALVEEDGVLIGLSGKLPVHPTLRLLLAPVRVLATAARFDPLHWRSDPELRKAIERAHALEALDFAKCSPAELLGVVKEAGALLVPLAGLMRRRYWPRSLLAFAMLRVWLAMLRRSKLLRLLLSGVETQTLQANRALEALALQLRAGEPGFSASLERFLAEHGHRETVLATLHQPTWRDAPQLVRHMLEGLAAAPAPQGTPGPSWEEARDEVLQHPLLRLPLARGAFERVLAQARCFFQLREDTHFQATLPMPAMRRAVLALGQRLVEAGVLGNLDDVFQLTLAELEAMVASWPPGPEWAGELRPRVERRRRRRAEADRVPLVALAASAPDGHALVRGDPGSGGIAAGEVCLVRDASEFGKLGRGQVLVAPFTNPSWTPLFARAAAVVVDTGGASSHAAIVAREYGIPAVMGTGDATRRLVDGQRVRVDGNQGVVRTDT